VGYAAGEARELPLRPTFDRRIKLEFHGARITSDGGLLAYRELDAALGLTEIAIDRPGNCSPLAKCGRSPEKLCLRHLAPTHVPALSALPGVLERGKVAFGSRHPGNLGLRQIYLGDDAFVAQMKSRVDAADTLGRRPSPATPTGAAPAGDV